MSSILIFFLFFFSFIIFSLTGFFIVRTLFIDVWDHHLPEKSMSISGSILAVLSIFVSLPLSFIIIFLWTNYNDTIQKLQNQANELLQLYNLIKISQPELLPVIKQFINRKITFAQLQYLLKNISLSSSLADNEFMINNHVSVEIWVTIGLGCGSVICATWFVKSPFLLHLYLIMSVAGILGSLVFLVYYYNTIDCYTCIREQLQKQLIEQLK